MSESIHSHAKSSGKINYRHLRLINLTILLLSFLLLSGINSFAEEDLQYGAFQKPVRWVNIGLGRGSERSSFGISCNQQYRNWLLSSNFTYNASGPLYHNTGFPTFNGAVTKRVWDLGILFGKMIKTQYTTVAISAGLSLVGGHKKKCGSLMTGG